MGRKADYFPLSLESLRALGGWAADCAERALPVFAKYAPDDDRPRAAIGGVREFAAGGKRAARLRALAMDAHRAGREAGHPAAVAAARAASLAASSAYTHPLRDVRQTVHVLGPAAYAALALELDQGGDPDVGDGMLRWAIEHAPSEVRDILLQMPAREAGKGRLSGILFALDGGIR
jgi:hypothetical protein